MGTMIDHTGEVYGQWTIKSKTTKRKVLAECSCGIVKEVFICNLLSGKTISCGCHRSEISKQRMTTHGHSKTNLYYVWLTMRNRCRNDTVKSYQHYGGRGITVCDDWNKSYESFEKWANNNGYCEGLQIDRIDNNGNYEPNNCHFVTQKENANNTSRNHRLEIKGEVKTISEWSLFSGIKRQTIQSRLKYGWDNDDLLITPTKGANQYSNLR